MPKQPKEKKAPAALWRKKKPEEASEASEPEVPSSSRAPAKKEPAHKVKKIEPHSDTSEVAKEFMKDRQQAKKFTKTFSSLLQIYSGSENHMRSRLARILSTANESKQYFSAIVVELAIALSAVLPARRANTTFATAPQS